MFHVSPTVVLRHAVKNDIIYKRQWHEISHIYVVLCTVCRTFIIVSEFFEAVVENGQTLLVRKKHNTMYIMRIITIMPHHSLNKL